VPLVGVAGFEPAAFRSQIRSRTCSPSCPPRVSSLVGLHFGCIRRRLLRAASCPPLTAGDRCGALLVARCRTAVDPATGALNMTSLEAFSDGVSCSCSGRSSPWPAPSYRDCPQVPGVGRRNGHAAGTQPYLGRSSSRRCPHRWRAFWRVVPSRSAISVHEYPKSCRARTAVPMAVSSSRDMVSRSVRLSMSPSPTRRECARITRRVKAANSLVSTASRRRRRPLWPGCRPPVARVPADNSTLSRARAIRTTPTALPRPGRRGDGGGLAVPGEASEGRRGVGRSGLGRRAGVGAGTSVGR
jgi:hypothetical protein